MHNDFSLFKLYHPSGIAPGEWDQSQRICSCGVSHAELIGCMPRGAAGNAIEGTPGMLAIAEERRRSNAAKRQGVQKEAVRPWKGARVSSGEVTLIVLTYNRRGTLKGCSDAACQQTHETRYGERLHLATYPARVYTLPNGAEARVRTDAKLKL